VTRYALLLRGINVGRAHRIAMADLRELLTAEGHGGVATLLQSGNVALDSDLPADELARAVERALERRFGFPVPTVVRTAEEIAAVVAADPLGQLVTDPSRYVVSFAAAAEVPDDVVDLLRSTDPRDDAFAVAGRELYLWCPHGQLDSPLAAALAKHDGAPSTARNWRTVLKLAELLQR
jgi:uncharacterized protein (DUF1697 family)